MTLLIIIFSVCPLDIIETIIHPKKWLNLEIQNIWEEVMILSPTVMTRLYQHLRKNMKTHLTNLDVAWLQNLCRESTDMFPESLCRMELAEFKTVCESWTNLLQNTHPTTSTSSPNTETTSTFHTSAGTRATLVGVPSSFEEHFGINSDDVDFVGFLERSTSAQSITETYCDTYLRATDASTQLEASERMDDYLIDINIYKRKDIWDKPKGDYLLGATARCRGTFPA